MSLLARLEARTPPAVALAVAVAAVSTSAILIKLAGAPPAVEALYRVAFTTLLVAPAALYRHRAEFRALARRDALFATLAGVALAAHFSAWFLSVESTTVAASVTLVQTQPLFVAVGGAVLLDERVTRRQATGIAVAVLGMAVMTVGEAALSGPAGTHSLVGDALAVLGAVAAAAYVLAGRSLRQRVALLPYVTVVYSVCAVALLGVALARGDPLTGFPARDWALFVAMAVGPGVFGHTVINWALAHVESSVVSVSLLGEPVGSTLLAVAVFGQVPTAATLVGGAVLLGGILATARER